MLAQRLRQRITIREQVEETTTYGEGVGYVWQDWLTDEPAEVLTGPGREMQAANAKQAETTARITFRWRSGLTAAMQILWDGRTYDIKSIETDATGRKEYRLQCTDGVNNGA